MGWALLALLVLHWPIIIFGGPVAARLAARRQHLDVSLALSGTLWTNLTISDLRAIPLGTGATPVESIRIEKLRFDYNLWRLARRGLGEFLSSYEVRRADLAFIAQASRTDEEREVKKSVIETLRTILAQPAAYSDQVEIDDFSIRVRSAESETVVRGISALFHPEKTGHFRMERMQIPGLPVWENLSAETTYVNRHLVQRGMRLGPHIVIDELSYDASRRAEGRGEIGLKSHGFGGEFSLLLTGQEKQEKGEYLAQRYDTHLRVAIAGVRVREAAEYFGVKGVPIERLESFALDFTGDPEKPRSWGGSARTVIENLAAGSVVVPRLELASEFARGIATTKGGVQFGRNSVALESRIALPERIDDWLASEVDATARIDAPELTALAASFLPNAKAGGAVVLDAKLGLHERRASAQARFQARNLVFDQVTAPTADGEIDLATTLSTDGKLQPATLDAKINVTTGAVSVSTFTIDSVRVALDVANGNAALRQLAVNRGSNSISATGRVQLPADLKQLARSAGEMQLAVRAPQLAEFGVAVKDATLAGQIEAEARVQFADAKANGDVQMSGRANLGEFHLRELGARARLRGHTIELEQFAVALSDTDRLTLKGRFETEAPRLYDGSFSLGIRDLAVLAPLLATFGVKETLGGALDVSWTGRGALVAGQRDGEASVTLRAAKYGKVDLNEFALRGSYTAEQATAELRAVSGPTQLSTQIAWADERVTLRDLELRQGDQRAATGEISYGLAGLGTPAFDPMKQPVAVSLHADKLDLEKLLTSIAPPAAASGQITAHLAAHGTALRPEVELKVEARGLKAKAVEKVDPAEVDLALNYVPGTLTLDGSARQPLLQPLSIKARVPLDLERVAARKKIDPTLPLDLSVKLPPTSLAVLPKLVPAVRRIDGTVAIDVQAGGTIEKPELSGQATVALKDARMTNENVPAIGQFDARLVFAKDTLNVERCGGIVGGGRFDLSGTIGLASFTDPGFGLRLRADEVLVKRDDSITVRIDSDVKITGALKAAEVNGEVVVTQSRFFKEIDILPIALPGRPKPEPKPTPKSAPSQANISLPPPLDAWKFNVAIKTRSDDPFRVRGNLANGAVALNLLLGGEGKEPWLEGEATIEQFTGSLPFSAITVENGRVFFTRNAPFQPTLDIRSQSKIREYTITAHVFGDARQPQLELTSEPPLPHSDIVTLIATGTTTGELSGNADILATRAAMFALEEIWRKVFKKKAPPKEKPRDDASFVGRFDLDFGGTDQQTGAREANARFKINDQFYILGEFDTRGGYTGSLKYLLRFR